MARALRHLLPRSRRLRWLLGALLSIVALLAVCEMAGWPFLRQPLAGRLSDSLQREVEIGRPFKLRLLGAVRLHSASLRVGSPPGMPVVHDREGRPQPFIDARGIDLVIPYSTLIALLRGDPDATPRVRSLDVEQLELGLARNVDGNANWRIGPPDQPPETDPTLPEFGRLVVRQGRLRLDDALTQLVLDARLSTREGVRAEVGAGQSGGLEVNAVGSYRDAPLQAQLQSSGLLPLAAPADGAAAPTVPLKLDMRIGKTHLQLDGHGADLLALSALDAQVRLAGPSLAAVGDVLHLTLPTTEAFDLQGQLRKAGPVWSSKVSRLTVGSSRLNGEFEYDPRPEPPLLSGRLGGQRLVIADLAPAFGAPAGAADPTPQRVLPQRKFELSALAAMNADVAVRLDAVDLGTSALANVRPLNGKVRLRDRVLAIDELHAETSGGELRGRLSLDARREPPRWLGDLRWANVRLEQFVRPRKPRAEQDGAAARSARATAIISGMLGGRARFDGRGSSIAAMLGSIDGSAELWLRDGRMSSLLVELIGLDLAEALGVVIAGDDGVPIQCAVARLAVHNGIVLPEIALIATSDSTLFASGQVSLADERLALKLTTQPHDMSLLSLRTPVHVKGTFVKPEIDLEAGKIGLRVAGAAALASIAAPLAGLLALTDLGEPEREVCGQALQRLKSPNAPRRATPAKDK